MKRRPDVPRFLIGIDLGTTNSALAYVDLERGARQPLRTRLLAVPQATAPGEFDARDALPSFLYFPSDDERASGTRNPDWAGDRGALTGGAREALVGTLARDRGALVPTRHVSSAKSWLCHPAVDRTAAILPWGAEEPLISPVDASARILAYLRDGWNHVIANGAGDDARLERQDVVLTVPASFDQEARELTLQAARAAGFGPVTLLEEPLAAFYAWIAAHRPRLERQFKGGEQLLVCDVGGGTSDFTLITVRLEEGRIEFERTAVGEHLLLGGDNLDLALARQIEQKLGERSLSLVQRLALRRSASAAKERLLSEEGPERVPITVLGSGRALVGGTLTAELTRQEVIDALTEGFLPLVPAEARPVRDRRPGLRELGLPYAGDAAITRHLAAFLEEAGRALGHEPGRLVRPDAVLLNGGFFTPAVARERLVEAIGGWFDPTGVWRPTVLENKAPAAAVALGAAYYGLVRHGGGLRVRAGSSRAYYIGVAGTLDERVTAVCILPRGTEEGTTFDLGVREFAVMTNRPVSFPLFSSATRRDAVGDLISLGEEEVHRHAPLTTVLRFGRKSRSVELEVGVSASFTETGTLEVSLASRSTDHRWRLQFQLRGERDVEMAEPGEESESIVPAERLAAAQSAIEAVFGAPQEPPAPTPEELPARLEAELGFGRQAWPLAVIRALADTLLRAADRRRLGPRHEARWLNLLGFCVRPGFGAPLDEWRIDQARRVYVEGLAFPSELQCQVEWIVLWQRAAGGLKGGQQRELFQRYVTVLELRAGRRATRVNTQVQREAWRLLASLERLPAGDRAWLGDLLVERLARDPDNASYLWAIGRLGARIPAYGPLNAVVPPPRAEQWIERLLSLRLQTPALASAVAQIGARSEDHARDISPRARERAAARLTDEGFGSQIEALLSYVPPASRDAFQTFGESLPVGLRLGQATAATGRQA